jgi:hypothetical protein
MAFGDTVQSVDSTWTGEGTINFGAATAGNLLIVVEARGAPHSAGGAWGAPADWNIIQDSGVNTGNMAAAFYYKIAEGGETSFTTSHTNESGVGQIAFAEFEGPFAASPLDVSAEDATHLSTVVTSQSTGTTGTTAQADELAIAAFAADSQSTVDGGGTRNYSNSFAEVIFTDVQTSRASAMIAKKILSATGTVECTFSVTDTGDEMYGAVATFKKAGASEITGTLSKTLGSLTTATAASVDVNGLLTKTLGSLALVSVSNVDINATFAKTLGSLALASSGSIDVTAALNKTLAALLLMSAGSVDVIGVLNLSLGLLTHNASGQVDTGGGLASTLGTLSSNAAAQVDVAGLLGATLGSLATEADGSITVTGSLNQVLSALLLVAADAAQEGQSEGGYSQGGLISASIRRAYSAKGETYRANIRKSYKA